MLKRRLVRLFISWLFDQMSDETLDMFNEEVDKEIAERSM